MKTSKFDRVISGLAVNGFFLSEIIRKYVIGSELVLILYELLLVFVAVFYFRKTYNRHLQGLVVITSTIFLWGLFVSVPSSYGLITLALGVRTYLIPISALIIGMRLNQTLEPPDRNRMLLMFVSFWILAISALAVVQIVVGPTHFLTVGVGRDEAIGLGDWGHGSELFRTTSIFQHTGKYGQIIFLLCVASAYLRSLVPLSCLTTTYLFVQELAAVLLSGQRAGLMFYLFVLLLLYAVNRRSAVISVTFIIAAVVVIVVVKPEWLSVFSRAETAIDEIPFRINENVLLPLGYALERYALFGVGFGAFSFGSVNFGGHLLGHVIKTGNAEDAYLRIMVETGVIGVILSSMFFLHAVFLALRRKEIGDKRWRNLRVFSVSVIFGVMLWGLTHDTLGATATTGMLFFFISPLYMNRKS
jgi:hypothetical protein